MASSEMQAAGGAELFMRSQCDLLPTGPLGQSAQVPLLVLDGAG